MNSNEVIVSGQRKGTGSSRETAAQCERWSGIRIVINLFAPIHERNNINLGQLMGDYSTLERLRTEKVLFEFYFKIRSCYKIDYRKWRSLPVCWLSIRDFSPALDTDNKPMTMAEKIIARNLVGHADGQW